MAELGILLLTHGEVTGKRVDIFDREAEFIETKLKPLVRKFQTQNSTYTARQNRQLTLLWICLIRLANNPTTFIVP